MKKLFLLLALATGCLRADTLLVSDFANYTPTLLVYSAPGNPADGPWTPDTVQSGSTAYTIGDFGAGAPSGLGGNGFFQYLAAFEDWSSYAYLTLTGTAASNNATPSMLFYVEDALGNAASANLYDLASFAGGASISLLLDLSELDATQIAAWGFLTLESTPTAFGFSFDNLALSTEAPALPDAGPGLAGLIAAVAVLGLVRARRTA